MISIPVTSFSRKWTTAHGAAPAAQTPWQQISHEREGEPERESERVREKERGETGRTREQKERRKKEREPERTRIACQNA